MLTRDDLQKLFARPDRTMNAVFTLYLNVASADYRQKLQRMLEEQRAGTFDRFEAVHLLAAVQEVERFFAAYKPGGRSLVFIFDRIDRFLWTRELQVPLRNMVHFSVRPYLRPLAEAMDAFPRYGVAVVEKNAVRLFTVGLGDIEEYSRPSVGVVDAIRRMVRSQHLTQLILAGQLEITTELRHSVAKRLGPILIGTIELDFNAEPAEIFQRTLPVAEELKRKEESEIVRDLTVQPARKAVGPSPGWERRSTSSTKAVFGSWSMRKASTAVHSNAGSARRSSAKAMNIASTVDHLWRR